MRVHEIAEIRGEDISPVAETITITGKGGRTDTLPAHQLILQQANLYPRRGLWFPSPRTRPCPYGPRPSAESSATRSTAPTHPQPPTSCATISRHHSYAQAPTSRVVQSLMRHESLATTGRYLAVNTDQQRTALSGLHPTPNATRRRVDASPSRQSE